MMTILIIGIVVASIILYITGYALTTRLMNNITMSDMDTELEGLLFAFWSITIIIVAVNQFYLWIRGD